MNETEIIKDKIQEILRTQKISKYDLALDIGISHATLYNFLSGIDISQKCLNKLAHFVRTYVTPEQKIEAYKLDAIEYEAEIKELKAKNDRLKEKYRTEKIYSSQVEELEESLNHLKQENERLKNCLQEIKRVAESAINGGYKTKSSDYSEGMETIGHYIMQKITKAEEE